MWRPGEGLGQTQRAHILCGVPGLVFLFLTER